MKQTTDETPSMVKHTHTHTATTQKYIQKYDPEARYRYVSHSQANSSDPRIGCHFDNTYCISCSNSTCRSYAPDVFTSRRGTFGSSLSRSLCNISFYQGPVAGQSAPVSLSNTTCLSLLFLSLCLFSPFLGIFMNDKALCVNVWGASVASERR